MEAILREIGKIYNIIKGGILSVLGNKIVIGIDLDTTLPDSVRCNKEGEVKHNQICEILLLKPTSIKYMEL